MKKTIYMGALTVLTMGSIIIGSMMHLGGWFGLGKSEQIEVELPVDGVFDRLRVDCAVADLKITAGEGFAVHYAGSENLKPEVRIEDNTLIVLQRPKKQIGPLQFGIGSRLSSDIEITVPQGVLLAGATVQADVGDLTLRDFAAEQVEIDCNVGDCKVEQVDFTALDAEMDIGDFTLKGDGSKSAAAFSDYALDLSVDLGEIKVDGAGRGRSYTAQDGQQKSIRIKGNIGDIELNG